MNIPTAKEIWEQQPNKNDFEDACMSVLKDIRRAQERGLRETCFNPRPYEQYEAAKRKYQSLGYEIKPTGYIGGVWQLTEHIHW